MQTLNDTIDVSAEALQAATSHVPTAIVVLALILVALGTFATGLRFARDNSRPLVLSVIYVLAYVIVIEMMVDYDRPGHWVRNHQPEPDEATAAIDAGASRPRLRATS